MYEIWAVWPPDDPHASATGERVRLHRVLGEHLPDAAGKTLRELEILRAGLEIIRVGGHE